MEMYNVPDKYKEPILINEMIMKKRIRVSWVEGMELSHLYYPQEHKLKVIIEYGEYINGLHIIKTQKQKIELYLTEGINVVNIYMFKGVIGYNPKVKNRVIMPLYTLEIYKSSNNIEVKSIIDERGKIMNVGVDEKNNIEKKKKFKEQLADIDKEIKSLNTEKNNLKKYHSGNSEDEIEIYINNLAHIAESIELSNKKRTFLIEKQLAKRENQVKKLEELLGWKRVSDLPPAFPPTKIEKPEKITVKEGVFEHIKRANELGKDGYDIDFSTLKYMIKEDIVEADYIKIKEFNYWDGLVDLSNKSSIISHNEVNELIHIIETMKVLLDRTTSSVTKKCLNYSLINLKNKIATYLPKE